MNCAELELFICDYLDGTLEPGEREAAERHLAGCPSCAALVHDAADGLAFLRQAPEVEPPQELVTRILFDPPWVRNDAPDGGGLFDRLRALWQPLLEPRFAMGMAMTILSFAMLARFMGPVRQLAPEDLNPVKVWSALDNKVYRTWQRSVKFYEDIRFVYQIRSTLSEWQQQQQEEEQRAPEAAPAGNDERRLPVRQPPGAQPEP